jgi:hypothetical protein
MVAQSRALVFGAKQAAPLQFRHDMPNEIVESAREIWRHDVEAVCGAAIKPLLQRSTGVVP